MGRIPLDPKLRDSIEQAVPWDLHMCADPKTGLAITGQMNAVIEALIVLGFATNMHDLHIQDQLEAVENASITISGSLWTLHLPGLDLPEPTPGTSST